MNGHVCHCFDKQTMCDLDWVGEHELVHNEASYYNYQQIGDYDSNPKLDVTSTRPRQQQMSSMSHTQLPDDNANAKDHHHHKLSGDYHKSDNSEVAKIIPKDKATSTSSTSPCYGDKECDSMHQAFAHKLSFTNSLKHDSDQSKLHQDQRPPSSRNSQRSHKIDLPSCHHHHHCQQQKQQTTAPQLNDCSHSGTTEKYPSTSSFTLQKGTVAKTVPPLISAVNVIRPPCPQCGSRVAKCMGCGSNTYGQAYTQNQPTYSTTLDPAVQFNCCASNSARTPLDDICEKKLDDCIKDVSKNLKWVLNSLQRFKFCPMCGNPNCTA